MSTYVQQLGIIAITLTLAFYVLFNGLGIWGFVRGKQRGPLERGFLASGFLFFSPVSVALALRDS